MTSPSRRSIATAWIVALVAGVPAAIGSHRSTFAILGRDQGIFQYVAWALAHGQRAYSDFREINGPLIHAIHLVLLGLGGADEHRFRVLDMALESIVFFGVGAALPGAFRASRVALVERLSWGAAGWAVLAAQYLLHGWWQTAQRESFYDLFLLAAVAMQLVAQRPSTLATRARFAFLVGSGLLVGLSWFGKPTYLLFGVLNAAALVFDDESAVDKRRGLLAMAAGGALACAVMLAFLARYGDIGECVRIVGGEVPRLYRYIWKRSFFDAYTAWGNAPKLNYAFATLVATMFLFAFRVVPRRFAILTTTLVGGLVTFFVQGKGFPYHLHPVTAGTHLVWLGALVCVVERSSVAGRFVPFAGAAVLALQCANEAWMSDARRNRWDLAGSTAEARTTEAYYRQFPSIDFFPWDLREAAAFVRERTAESDRVQMYAMDPYLLFMARRLSATRFIYSFELDVDASLAGGSGGRPDEGERAWLVDLAKRHEAELLAELERSPPAAFVFVGGAPFRRVPDAEADFDAHCPNVASWMRARYAFAARFGVVTVWLRAP